VIGPLLRQVAVDRQVATILEGEGVLIDPVGAILAVVVLDTILNSDAGAMEVLNGLLLRGGVGFGVGLLGGAAMGLLLKRRLDFLSEDLKNLVVLAGVWGLFGISQMIRGESGLMAVVVAGVVVRSLSVPEERMIRRFKGQLTMLGVSVLFILLAADLSLASILALGWGSVLTVLSLMFLVRPLSVWVCTLGSGLNWRQKLFISWVGPKGIVSASVASLFAILLTQRGITGGDSLKAIVFLTIMMTVVIQGLSARWVARWLNLTSEGAKGAVIIGCNPLGRLLGELFQQEGESVVMIDTDQQACELAEAANLPVIQSSGLDETVLEEAGIESLGTFLAMTNNGEVNLVLAQRALEEFQPPRVFAAFPKNSQARTPANKTKVNQAFMSQIPIKVWNQYVEEGKIKLGCTMLREEGFYFQQAHLQALIRSGELLPLLVKRGNSLQVVKANQEWQPGEEIFYILHDPRPKLLKRLSGGNTTSRLALERLAEVEEVPLATPEDNN
jgi:NhaP-type Na+/H+ or K+/H+ antiporter